MSATNGHATSIDDLREEYRRLRLESRVAQAKAEKQLYESWWSIDPFHGWGGPGPGYNVGQYIPQGGYITTQWAGYHQDRRNQIGGSMVQTEQDLTNIRNMARALLENNTVAQGALETLTSFVVEAGMGFRATSKEKKATKIMPTGDKITGPLDDLVADVQDVIDEFSERIMFGELQQELFQRDRVDGEYLLRDHAEDDLYEPRTVEPEQLTEHAAPQIDKETRFGVRYAVNSEGQKDCFRRQEYYVQYEVNGPSETVPAEEMQHSRINVVRSAKRGLSDFFSTREAFDGARKLIRNMREGAAIQAAIVGLRQHASASETQATSFQNRIKAAQTGQPFVNPNTNREVKFQEYTPGTILDAPAGLEYAAMPWTGSGAPSHIAVVQAVYRSLGIRWCMPEYMISGDASNANYSSTLVVGSPFVRYVKRLQSYYKYRFLEIIWKAVRIAADAGRFAGFEWELLEKLVEIQCEPPLPSIVNDLEQAQIDEIDLGQGVLSKQTRAQRRGLDYEQEKINIVEDPPLSQQTMQMQQDGQAFDQQMAQQGAQEDQGGFGESVAHRHAALREFYGQPTADAVARAARELLEVTDASGHKHDELGKFAHTSAAAKASSVRTMTTNEAFEKLKQFKATGWEKARKGSGGMPSIQVAGGYLKVYPEGGYEPGEGYRFSERFEVFQSNDGGIRGSMLKKKFNSIEDATAFAEARFKMLVDQGYLKTPTEDSALYPVYQRAVQRQLGGDLGTIEKDKPRLPDGREIPKGMHACPKCAGYGNIPTYGHVADGVCFKCGGGGLLGKAVPESIDPDDADNDLQEVTDAGGKKHDDAGKFSHTSGHARRRLTRQEMEDRDIELQGRQHDSETRALEKQFHIEDRAIEKLRDREDAKRERQRDRNDGKAEDKIEREATRTLTDSTNEPEYRASVDAMNARIQDYRAERQKVYDAEDAAIQQQWDAEDAERERNREPARKALDAKHDAEFRQVQSRYESIQEVTDTGGKKHDDAGKFSATSGHAKGKVKGKSKGKVETTAEPVTAKEPSPAEVQADVVTSQKKVIATAKAEVAGEKTGIAIQPTKDRAFTGQPAAVSKISKQEAGRIGEEIIIAWLQSKGMKDARAMNLDRNNFPIDLIQDHETIEAKTGQASNGPGAQQWRLTIGEPGKAEKEWLAKASPEEKTAWNAKKQSAIHQRKQQVLDELGRELGHPIKASTMTVILNPDTKTADIYRFDGWHDRIGWNSELAQKSYIGSVRYA